MQAIAVASGGKLINMDEVHHGVAHLLHELELEHSVFKDLELPLKVARYHSWVIDEDNLDKTWKITARDSDGNPMAIQHVNNRFIGIQFHPESILTPQGKKMIWNFLHLAE